tara:strand:- start:171 stop:428 length:258 start_codon:yes stop_codon:yes gene_type:complete
MGEIVKADGFDEAIIGITDGAFDSHRRLVYDIDKCIDILVSRDGMTYEEAMEFFEFNVSGAHVGEGTPIYINKMSLKDLEDSDII